MANYSASAASRLYGRLVSRSPVVVSVYDGNGTLLVADISVLKKSADRITTSEGEFQLESNEEAFIIHLDDYAGLIRAGYTITTATETYRISDRYIGSESYAWWDANKTARVVFVKEI